MKRLLLVLVMLIIAGSAFAAELKVSGDMYVRGSEYSNLALAEDDESTYDRFDYDLNLNLAFVANENATVYTRLTFDKNVDGNGKIADGSASADDPGLAVERAYLNYKFAPFLQVNTGLMGGGQWGTAFGDTEINVMRVQLIGALSKDMVFIATYQKDDEGELEGAADPDDNEKDDTTIYYLSSKLVFGPITVLPLFTYATKGINYDGTTLTEGYTAAVTAATVGLGLDPAVQADRNQGASYLATGNPAAGLTEAVVVAGLVGSNDGYDITKMAFTLALKGDFGMVGFEAEGVYIDTDTDGFVDDHGALAAASGIYEGATYGAYVNIFAKVDPVKAGFVFAYGSADEEDGSYNWGDDFDMFFVIDDFVANSAAGLTGFTAYKLYADATIGKIVAGAALGMGYSNMEDDDAAFKEVDVYAGYNFDENTSYKIGFGYAMTEDFYAVDVDADAYRLFHKMSVSF